MDRQSLINRISYITNESIEELNKYSDEDLFGYAQYLEDKGEYINYND